MKTEFSSPQKSILKESNIKLLKDNLERLRKDSIKTDFLNEEMEMPHSKPMILRSINMSKDSGRSTVQQLYMNKQKS